MDGDITQYVLDLAATLPVVVSDTEAVYLYGLDIIAQQQSERLYYFHDGLGSVRQVVDTTGDLEANYAYDPFGVPVVAGDASNPYQFTGEAWDQEVELLYLRARYYQPETGRFITRDPWEGNVWRPATLHGYLYTGDNPINNGDPSGRQEVEPTPTPTERDFMECLEESREKPLYLYPRAESCRVQTVPEQEPLPQIRAPEPEPVPEMWAVNHGIGLLFQRTIAYPERTVSFWVLYAEERNQRYVPAIGGGYVKSGLELTVKMYMNGTFVDIYDTFDTTNLESLALALGTPPTLYRSIVVRTNKGTARGPLRFGNLWRERELPGVRVGPWSIGGGTERLDPLENPQKGEKGRGHVFRDTWFTPEQGLPCSVSMRLTIPELIGGVAAAATWAGDLPSYGGVGSYDESLRNIYPSRL